jgi:Tfp pilus assembly protein PilF
VALEDFKGAVDYLERFLAVVPEYEEGWMRLAQFSLLAGDGTKSEAAAKKLIELDPENYEPWFHLANMYDAIPDDAKAEEAYRRAAKLAPGQWKVLMNFGSALVQTTDGKKHAEAKAVLEEAVRVAPAGEWRPLYNLALAQVRLGEKSVALELARKIQREARSDDPMVAEARRLESNLLES